MKVETDDIAFELSIDDIAFLVLSVTGEVKARMQEDKELTVTALITALIQHSIADVSGMYDAIYSLAKDGQDTVKCLAILQDLRECMNKLEQEQYNLQILRKKILQSR